MNKFTLLLKIFIAIFTLSACGQSSKKTQKTKSTVTKNQASTQFKTGAEQTELYKSGTEKLVKQVADLNLVYGNMLNALS